MTMMVICLKPSEQINKTTSKHTNKYNETDEWECPHEAWPARENSSLSFIKAVH